MQCEKCKKAPATTHTTEMSHQKVKKIVHLCEECRRKTILSQYHFIQCEKCKKRFISGMSPVDFIGHPNAEPKIVYFCEECLRETLSNIQCEKCKKPSDIMFQVEISHPNAKPKKGYLCDKCIIEEGNKIQCKRCKRDFDPTGSITPYIIQELRSKSPGGIALVPIRCGKCGDRGTYEGLTLNYPE